MQILWVTPTIGKDFGGPTTTVVNGLIAENRAGLVSELVTTSGSSESADSLGAVDRLSEEGIPVRLFPRTGLIGRSEAWGFSPKLAVWLLRNASRYDVIHLQYVWCLSSIVGVIAGRLAGVPVVLTPHESLTDFDIEVASRRPALKLMKRVLRHLYLNFVDQMILMSQLEQRDTRSGSVPVQIVSHAVQEEPTEVSRDRLTPEDGLTMAFIGRNVEKKGIHLILGAISRRPERNRRIRIAGPPSDPSYRQRLEEIIAREGIANRVEWTGFVHDRVAWLKGTDVLVMPSVYEGFGMVSAEAMCRGVPVIVPERSGVAEIVSEFGAGIVMTESSVEMLDQALSELEADPDLLAEAGENALKAANTRLTFASFASRTAGIYRRLRR